MQELFCYLLLHHNRQHTREALAGMLWGDSSTTQSKKSLRQTLWYLQSALSRAGSTSDSVLVIEAEWIRFNPKADCWVDAIAFEQAWSLVQDVPGEALDDHQVEVLQHSVELYQAIYWKGTTKIGAYITAIGCSICTWRCWIS